MTIKRSCCPPPHPLIPLLPPLNIHELPLTQAYLTTGLNLVDLGQIRYNYARKTNSDLLVAVGSVGLLMISGHFGTFL